MRRRLSPEGLDIRDGIPENEVSELVLWAGLAVLALPFAQRADSLSKNGCETKRGQDWRFVANRLWNVVL
jgi:hypothetical protein